MTYFYFLSELDGAYLGIEVSFLLPPDLQDVLNQKEESTLYVAGKRDALRVGAILSNYFNCIVSVLDDNTNMALITCRPLMRPGEFFTGV